MARDRELEPTYRMLKTAYAAVPIIAGADKFTNFLCDWTDYLSPTAKRRLPMRPGTFMKAVGLVEMAVGGIVASKYTRLGAFAAAGWLGAIAANLVLDRRYDIAVRDVAMALGALTLAKLDELGPPLVKPAVEERHLPVEPSAMHAPETPAFP